MTTPAGWYPDNTQPGHERYWDGSQWTDQARAAAGSTSAPSAAPIGDPSEETLWEGQSETLSGAASGGRLAIRYRITPHHLYFERGVLSTNSQQVPLINVRDVDVKQTMTQKARQVGDVVVHLTSEPAPVTLESVRDAKNVRDIVNRASKEAKLNHQRLQTTQYHHGLATPPPAAEAATTGGPDLVEQLTKLAALRDQGILTDDEFAAQKAKLLA